MRLNKYLAQCGITSRRKSESIVKSGRIYVNYVKTNNPYLELSPHDIIQLDGKILSREDSCIVILLNKPKDTISTVQDTHDRKIITDLVDLDSRLFPIGRLDKDTTGVILLTNDGELAYKLTHPKFMVEKIYEVDISRMLMKKDQMAIHSGINIGNGEVGRGEIVSIIKRQNAKQSNKGKMQWRITIKLTHGKKREIRRIFSVLGYQVLRVNRISFAGITSDGLNVGEWRKLTQNEIIRLRYL